jgi:hypothetical protein
MQDLVGSVEALRAVEREKRHSILFIDEDPIVVFLT